MNLRAGDLNSGVRVLTVRGISDGEADEGVVGGGFLGLLIGGEDGLGFFFPIR